MYNVFVSAYIALSPGFVSLSNMCVGGGGGMRGKGVWGGRREGDYRSLYNTCMCTVQGCSTHGHHFGQIMQGELQ